MRILLVEDDELLGGGLYEGLKDRKYIVDWVKDGLKAEKAIKSEDFDAVILDIGLPSVSGFQVLEHVRNRGVSTPILVLTARETTEDCIKGLDLGADDYLVKPVELETLCARLRALQRRFNARTSSIITFKNIELDPSAMTVRKNQDLLNLPRREFALLHKLLENIGRVVSRENLSQNLYGWEDEVDSNALEVHIHNLRKKIGNDIIRTIRGVGYMIEKNINAID